MKVILMAAVVVVGSFLVTGLRAQVSPQAVHVDDPRPVAKAIRLLNRGQGVAVTYEDPPYSFQGDTKDITREVRSDRAPPRLLIPLGGVLDFSFNANSETGEPENWETTLQSVLLAHNARNSGGRFELVRNSGMFHVIPTEIRDANGRWVRARAVLDAAITIPKQETDGLAMIESIVASVSEETMERVEVGLTPTNWLVGYYGVLEASNETARDVLIRTLEATGQTFAWELFYSPGTRTYFLNMHLVGPPTVPAQPSPPSRPAIEPGSSPTGAPPGTQ